MLKFTNKQAVFRIAGVDFGGQPGKRRTVMVGSMFYPRHSVVEDRVEGKVKSGAVERLVGDMARASDETGCPTALMVFAETERCMRSHLEKVADAFKGPLFIDSPSAEVRIAGLTKAKEMGIQERVIYNTINAGVAEKELQALRDNGFRSAVLLAFNPGDIQAKGKIYLLENGGGILPQGMVELAQSYGIDRPLLDMAVMASEQGAGSALRGIMIAKAKWGLPCGCAMHNAVESYPPLAKLQGEDRKLFRYVDVAASTMPVMAGADYVMYGPIEFARRTFHAVAFADQLMAQAASEL
jgi:tetrahydromethanopterin S-methyltransferase subunit H